MEPRDWPSAGYGYQAEKTVEGFCHSAESVNYIY